ncbi:MAG: glycosyltransferase family 4 protein, partial [Actinomycetota bacterium]|nr:glycosyltransferase family 4 protein [Actinomycetota bacterium]
AVNLARELARRGHEVALAATNDVEVPIEGVRSIRLERMNARSTGSPTFGGDDSIPKGTTSIRCRNNGSRSS